MNSVSVDALVVLCSASAKLYVDDTSFSSNVVIGPETYLQAINDHLLCKKPMITGTIDWPEL